MIPSQGSRLNASLNRLSSLFSRRLRLFLVRNSATSFGQPRSSLSILTHLVAIVQLMVAVVFMLVTQRSHIDL